MQQPTATEAAWSEHVVCMQESSAYCSTVHNVAAMPNGAPKGAVACPKRVQLGDHALQCSLISRHPLTHSSYALVHSGDSAVLWCVWYDYLPGGGIAEGYEKA